MRQPDLETRLQDAIRLAQAGRRAEARDLLESVVAEDPSQELAYVWLAAVSRDRGERLQFLRRALAINPGNVTAQRAFQKLTGQPYAAATSRALPPPERGTFSGNTLFIVALGLIVVAAVVLASYIGGGGGDNEEAAATHTATLAPGAVAPAQATAAPSATPRPRNTAAPTRTPGPSPTSVWVAPPITWTPAPTGTEAPTRTPAPTWTPRPTITPSPTVTPVAG
jgi:hypothetical protein